ncbi:MAG: hypothetical protein JXB32_08090 [Deltaproteobacteria bacterium]|nr:hypothetical protein [Deltaproteobacteria bacterium]
MFPGFALDDFDPYLPERATSNVYNRQRLAVKEKLLEIARAAADAVRTADPDLEPAASDHAPTLRNGKRVESQWSFFWRGPERRAGIAEVIEGSRGVAELLADPPPWRRHAVLAATVAPDGFAVALRISAQALVDAANLRALLADPDHRDRLLAALHALPEPFAFVVPGDEPVPAPAVTPTTLEAFLAAFSEAGTAWFEVRRTWPKPEAAAAGSSLLRSAAEDLGRLAPLYGAAAWTPENDHVGFDELLERVRLERTHEEEEHDGAQRAFSEKRAESQAAARERMDRMFADRPLEGTRGGTREIPLPSLPAWAPVGRRRREEPAEPPAAGPPASPPPAEARAGDDERPTHERPATAQRPRPAPEPPRPSDRKPPAASGPRHPAHPASSSRPVLPAPPPAAEGAATGGLAPGSLVRFREGPLRGRVGTLFEITPRGEARVMLGLFTTRVPADQLVEVRRRRAQSP